MEELIRKNKPFSVLLVVVRNLDGLQNCYSASVIASAVRGFQSRFENLVPSTAIVDRWAKNQFAAILSTAPGPAIEMSRSRSAGSLNPFSNRRRAERTPWSSTRAPVSSNFTPAPTWPRLQAKLRQLADALIA